MISDFMSGASFCRESENHGGSAVYLHKTVEYNPRNKINKLSVINDIECADVECKVNDTALIIISIYMTPTGNIDIFLKTLENIL